MCIQEYAPASEARSQPSHCDHQDKTHHCNIFNLDEKILSCRNNQLVFGSKDRRRDGGRWAEGAESTLQLREDIHGDSQEPRTNLQYHAHFRWEISHGDKSSLAKHYRADI